jgi:PAS domain-containing protein
MRRLILYREVYEADGEIILWQAHDVARYLGAHHATARQRRKVTGRIITARDVTDRHAAEVQLRQACAVEHSPASVVITDTTGRIEYVNPVSLN